MVDPHGYTKVILVEDDASVRNVLKTLLELEGFQVRLSPAQTDEEQILAEIKAETPDIILMDVHLREISGIDILRRMRADTSLQNVRVVMTSGMDKKDECLNAGASAFLMKPYMPEDLIDTLKLFETL